jgi:hypothetical protein
MTPSKKSIGELLGVYERRPIVLPEFQRSYSWEKSQTSTFWGDLRAFKERFAASPVDATYFLGPVVTIETKQDICLLDGQQRLATATIFLSVLRDIARHLHGEIPDKDLDKEFDYFARDIQRELIEKKDTNPLQHSFSLGDLDEPYFLQSIKTDPPSSTKQSLRSHQLIARTREYFLSEMNDALDGLSPKKKLLELIAYRDALTKGMSLVVIVVEDEQDANDVFEALNDRGLRLSVPDLVVNLLLKRCGSNKDRRSVRQTWNSMLQQMGQRDVARFLRHLWLSQYGDLKAKGLYTEIKEHLVQKKITSVDFAQSCLEACDDYVKILQADHSLPKAARTNVEGLVRYLGVQNCIPLLLSGYRHLSQSDFTKLAKEIVTIYIRHSLISNQNPLQLETAFYDAAREIHAQVASKVTSAKALSAAKAKLKALNPADTLVQQQFVDLHLSKQEAGWFMVQLANTQQSKTKEIGMEKANVEHIFPQNAGAAWPNSSALEPPLWHVGNLTILGNRINASAQNKSFADKCKEHYSASEVVMTKALLKIPAWNEAAIRARAKVLAGTAIQTWKKT